MNSFHIIRSHGFVLPAVFLAVALFAILAVSCKPIFKNSGPVGITIRSATFTLAWDTGEPALPDLPSSTKYFKIYYRKLNTKKWTLLNTTEGFSSRAMVFIDELKGSGKFEFGVESVSNNGRKSGIHASSDFTAVPPGGWYAEIK